MKIFLNKNFGTFFHTTKFSMLNSISIRSFYKLFCGRVNNKSVFVNGLAESLKNEMK